MTTQHRFTPPAPLTTPIDQLGQEALSTLDALVAAITRDGIAEHEQAVLAIVDLAEEAGIRPGLTTVMVEPAASPATRERAFALLVKAIADRIVASIPAAAVEAVEAPVERTLVAA